MESCSHFDIWQDGDDYEECECDSFRSRIGTLHAYMKSMTKLDLQKLREEAIVEVLHQKLMNVNHIERLLDWDMIQKEDGWIPNTRQSLCFDTEAFNSIQGFKVNRQTGQVDFSFKKGDPLISLSDIQYIVNGGFTYLFFSLDAPNYEYMPYHPFQQFRFGPKHLEQGDILNTVPFRIRPIEDNLLKRLPKYLQHAVRSTDKRDQSQKIKQTSTRYWIESESVQIEDQTNLKEFCYIFGDVKMVVKQHPMSKQGSDLKDDASLMDENSADADFVKDFTKYYDQIALWFPEYNRLKEISKALLMTKKLYEIHKQMVNDANSCQNNELRNTKISAANKLGSYLGTNQNICNEDQSQMWVPATFSKFIYPYSSRLTYGGVSLSPNEVQTPINQQQSGAQIEQRNIESIVQKQKEVLPSNSSMLSQLSTTQLSNVNKKLNKSGSYTYTYDRMNKIMNMSIIHNQECSNKKDRNKLMVPCHNNGVFLNLFQEAIGQSGCTIFGLDLGQLDHYETEKILKDIPGAYDKLKAYVGLKKQLAIQALKDHPVEISEEMAQQIAVAQQAHFTYDTKIK